MQYLSETGSLSMTKVNLSGNIVPHVAHCWYSDRLLYALAIMYTNDDQIGPMNAISDTQTNFYFHRLFLGQSYPDLYCSFIANITHC